MLKCKLAIQGELGSFSHAAATKLLPRAVVVPCARSRQVFELLDQGKVQRAVVPIENTLAGSVGEHLDLMLEFEFFAARELHLRIEHNLIAMPGVRLKNLRRVFSHPVALGQCRRFFEKHRSIEPVPFYDTAGSVKHVMNGKLSDAGAIAGPQAHREFGGKILARSLEDNKQNFTRFFLLSRERSVARDANKTSIVFATRNVPGALFKALSVFALREIDLSKIESRPVPGKPWEYVFYADLVIGDAPLARRCFAHLREVAEFVKLLGIYPAA
jgi:prephenate dehydratase